MDELKDFVIINGSVIINDDDYTGNSPKMAIEIYDDYRE